MEVSREGWAGVSGLERGRDIEGAPGLVGVREGKEAEAKGHPPWPGLSHPTSWQPGAPEQAGKLDLLGEPWPDLAVATCCPGGPDQLRQVVCWVPTPSHWAPATRPVLPDGYPLMVLPLG